MQNLIQQGWNRCNMEIIPNNSKAMDIMCFAHPSSTAVERLPLPWNPFDVEGRCYNHIPDGTAIIEPAPEELDSEKESENLSSTDSDDVEVESVEAIVETTKVVVAEAPASELLEEEVRRTIDLLRADGMDMMQVMEHPKFAEVSERASAANVDVWTMVVSTFQ